MDIGLSCLEQYCHCCIDNTALLLLMSHSVNLVAPGSVEVVVLGSVDMDVVAPSSSPGWVRVDMTFFTYACVVSTITANTFSERMTIMT